MLILEAEICFDKPCDNIAALPHDIDTKNILRPDINFGNSQLFSGTIIVGGKIDIIKRGEIYKVFIEMPTIEKKAYEEISQLLQVDATFKI
jgi:hypothetical protein